MAGSNQMKLQEMAIRYYIFFAILTLIPISTVYGSWNDNFASRGYIKETPILWQPPSYLDNVDWRFDNPLHLRNSFRYYANDNFTFGLELKTRLYLGESVDLIRVGTESSQFGKTYYDLDRDFIDEENFVLSTAIDRAWVNYIYASLELTLGRQRVAWGTNLIWNPIDIFNPSSPLDFDNEEMPGADVIKAQYYFGTNSHLEFAIAPQEITDSSTAALLLKVNKWQYDWMFIGGRRGYETVWGFAWAGNILDGGFRGEALYSVPRKDAFYVNENIVVSVSGDYSFPNSLYIHSGVLYNDLGTEDNAGGFWLLRSYFLRWLTPAKYSLFGQIAKDLSPLIRADINSIYNPNDESWYLGPSLTWSAKTDFDITFSGLIFGGDDFTEFGDNGGILMLRAKYSF